MRKALVVLAEARQASVTGETLLVYSQALEKAELEDVREAVKALSRRVREQGETAFPDLGTVLAAVKLAKSDRREREREEQRRAEAERERRDRKANPQNYTGEHEVFGDVLRAKGLLSMDSVELPKPPARVVPPERKPCMHCGLGSSPQTPEECRRFAGFYEQRALRMEARAVEESLAEA